MPEGHTIHRIARDHGRIFAGQKLIVESPQGRFANEARELSGQKLTGTDAHGKHLFYLWENGKVVHIHLGLYGKFRTFKNPPPEPKGAVRLRVIGESHSFDLNGPNCCELIGSQSYKDIRGRLGEDPLRADSDANRAWQKISKSQRTIAALMLDQTVIAGIGNVYRAEILFLMKINPERPGCSLSEEEFKALWDLTTDLLQLGVRKNRIVTTPFRTSTIKHQHKSERLNIYKKDYCPVCGDYVYYWLSANRNIYACDTCQI